LENLKQWAAELGLNTKDFNECLDTRKMSLEVSKDYMDAQKYGLVGTPTFFINGIVVNGAYPYETFQDIIEQELSRISTV